MHCSKLRRRAIVLQWEYSDMDLFAASASTELKKDVYKAICPKYFILFLRDCRSF